MRVLLITLKYTFVVILFLNLLCCEEQNVECETETVCYGAGNCIEKPISGSCF